MGTVNVPNPRVDATVRIFDGFYGYETEVDANDYDVVNSYFESVFGTGQAAANFAVTLFRIAEETGTPVLTLALLSTGRITKSCFIGERPSSETWHHMVLKNGCNRQGQQSNFSLWGKH